MGNENISGHIINKRPRGLHADAFQWSSLVSVWRLRSSNEIKWKCWMFFLKEGENLMIVLQKRFDWKTVVFGATEVHTHIANVKEYPPPRVSAQPRAIEYLWQKFSAFFSAKISLRKFQALHKQRFGFCDSSLFPYATMTFTTTLLRNLARAPKR